MQTIAAGAYRTAAVAVGARIPASAGLTSSKHFLCVFEALAGVAVENLLRYCAMYRVTKQIHTPRNPALALHSYISYQTHGFCAKLQAFLQVKDRAFAL